MSWTYADYDTQATTPEIITRLKLHMTEVRQNAGRPDVAADAKSAAYGGITGYLQFLQKELRWYMSFPDATGAVNGGTSLARFRRGR